MSGPVGLFTVGSNGFSVVRRQKLRSAQWKMFQWKLFPTTDAYFILLNFYSARVVWPPNLIYIEKLSVQQAGACGVQLKAKIPTPTACIGN